MIFALASGLEIFLRDSFIFTLNKSKSLNRMGFSWTSELFNESDRQMFQIILDLPFADKARAGIKLHEAFDRG